MELLIPDFEIVGAVGSGCSAVWTSTVSGVERAAGLGYGLRDVFYLPEERDAPVAVPDKCRPVVSSLVQLQQIDRAAVKAGSGLVSVGLQIVPSGFHAGSGIPVDELAEIARALPSLSAVTVRGCFVCGELDGLHGRDLGRFFRACYESAKIMTVTLPCAMPYLCAEGGLAALERNRAEHPETLEAAVTAAQIVAAQNSTAFYARLLIT